MPVQAAIIGAAVIGGGASLLAASKGSSAAKKAAETQSAASNRAADIQYKIWQEGNALQEPWRETGTTALDTYSEALGLPARAATSLPQTQGGYLPSTSTAPRATAPRATGSGYTGARTKEGTFRGRGYLDPEVGYLPAPTQRPTPTAETPLEPDFVPPIEMDDPVSPSPPEDTIAGLPAIQTQTDILGQSSRSLPEFNMPEAGPAPVYTPYEEGPIPEYSLPEAGIAPEYDIPGTSELMEGYENDPYTQFRISEALRGAERSAAARGNFYSGALVDELATRQGRLAGEGYERELDRRRSDYQTGFGLDREDFYRDLARSDQAYNVGYQTSLGDYYSQLARDDRAAELGYQGSLQDYYTQLSRGDRAAEIGYQGSLQDYNTRLNNQRTDYLTGIGLEREDYYNDLNYRTNAYETYMNRLQGLAGAGQQGSQALASQGMQTGQVIGGALQNAANAQAQGYLGSANAWQQGLAGVGSAFGQAAGYLTFNQMYNNNNPNAVTITNV